VTSADLVVALANAQAVRRPTGFREAFLDDALGDPASATELLRPFLDQPVDERDLTALRALHRAVAAIVDGLIEGSRPPLDALNALAGRELAIPALKLRPDGGLQSVLRPKRPSVPGKLLLEVVRQFGELEVSRLRRCGRPECRLVFYDRTRSATQRWHAERPCGLRERQRRHRARHGH
jgi:predicted RNA-binding Zn ribbon-like protein